MCLARIFLKHDFVLFYLGSDEIYEDVEETASTSAPSKSTNAIPNVPPHSLTAFGLFLRLPGYADYLLRDMKKALCLLRLVLGVTDDGEGTKKCFCERIFLNVFFFCGRRW